MNEMSPVAADREGGTASSTHGGTPEARTAVQVVADRKYLALLIGGVSVLGSVAFVALVMASGASGTAVRSEESRKASVEHQDLAKTRHKAANAAGGYAVLDAKAGRYRVPVERAIEIVAKHPELLKAPVAKAPVAKAPEPVAGAVTPPAAQETSDQTPK